MTSAWHGRGAHQQIRVIAPVCLRIARRWSNSALIMMLRVSCAVNHAR